MMNGEKNRIRQTMLARRGCIPIDEARAAGRAMLDILLSSQLLSGDLSVGQSIALFSPIRGEPDLLSDATKLKQIGLTVCLPRVTTQAMDFYLYNKPEDMVDGIFGLREPAYSAERVSYDRLRAVLCPGLAFDRHGTRLGYGKGYYDRYFGAKNQQNRPVLIGVSYPFQVLDDLPQNNYDVSMDYLLTTDKMIKCRK